MKTSEVVGPPNAIYWSPRHAFCNGCKSSRLEHHVFENQQACSFCIPKHKNDEHDLKDTQSI